MNRDIKNDFLLLLLCIPVAFFSLTNCNGNQESEYVYHPINEKIPFYNHEYISINTETSFDSFDNKPASLEKLWQILEKSEIKRNVFSPLDLATNTMKRGYLVTSIDSDRLLILDLRSNELLEYDLNSNLKTTLAEFGRDLKGINSPVEFAKYNNYYYVARNDGYINRYNCSTYPCEYVNTISMEYSPQSLTIYDRGIGIIGLNPFTEIDAALEEQGSLNELQPARILNHSGDLLSSFGKVYEVNDHPLLIQTFVNDAVIRYSPSVNVFILIYKPLPFIYIYDAETLEVSNIYHFEDFIVGGQRFWPESPNRLEIPLDDNSRISNAGMLEGNYLWLEMLTRYNYQRDEESGQLLVDEKYDYYVVDIQAEAGFYIGSYEQLSSENSKTYSISDHGISMYDYESGTLFWTGSN